MKKIILFMMLVLVGSASFAQFGGIGRTTVAKVVGLQDSLNLKLDNDKVDTLGWYSDADVDLIAELLKVPDLVNQSKVLDKLVATNLMYSPYGTSQSLNTGSLKIGTVIFQSDTVINSMGFYVSVAGNFTETGDNKIALFSTDGTTLTQVAISADIATTYKSTGFKVVSFTTPVSVNKNTRYLYAFLYNQSAQTTAPSLAGSSYQSGDIYQIGKSICYSLASQTTMPTTIAESSITATINLNNALFYKP